VASSRGLEGRRVPGEGSLRPRSVDAQAGTGCAEQEARERVSAVGARVCRRRRISVQAVVRCVVTMTAAGEGVQAMA
jgi:hypothetical protein